MQRELAVIGNVVRELAAHPAREIQACKTIGQALYRALIYAGETQESIAPKVGASTGYLSMILTGKRRCPAELVLAVVAVTKSMAPLQWMASQVGAEVYLDKRRAREVELERELAILRAEDAA